MFLANFKWNPKAIQDIYDCFYGDFYLSLRKVSNFFGLSNKKED